MRKMFVSLLIVVSCFLQQAWASGSPYAFDWKRMADEVYGKQVTYLSEWVIANVILAHETSRADAEFLSEWVTGKAAKYRDIRKLAAVDSFLSKACAVGDTLLFIEHYPDMQQGVHMTFWNKSNPQYCMTVNGTYRVVDYDLEKTYYPPYVRNLCADWNLAAIRESERNYTDDGLSSGHTAYALVTRIILKSIANYGIDCFFFLYHPSAFL